MFIINIADKNIFRYYVTDNTEIDRQPKQYILGEDDKLKNHCK